MTSERIQCPGQSYFISAEECELRRGWDWFVRCNRCSRYKELQKGVVAEKIKRHAEKVRNGELYRDEDTLTGE